MRREVPAAVGCANGCAVQIILLGAVVFLLTVLGYHLF